VSGELRFRKDLYKGTAEYYDRFRPPYPAALLDDLNARVPLARASRVLDLACGTGQIAFALANDVAEVWAVDQEPESVEFAARKAQRLGVTSIRWIAATAEDMALEEVFDLVAIGNAFHRLDRNVVANRVARRLPEGGCLALLWSDTPTSGDEPWQSAMREAFERWMDAVGARNRLPAGWEEVMARDPNEQVLRRAGLTYEGKFEFSVVKQWTIESLIGFVYSTSLLSRGALGDHADAFENDLQEQLLRCCPDGVFEQDLTFAYELARHAA
jgi:ubiquinone/menaquinone biosynthesis C-methylase UbiE